MDRKASEAAASAALNRPPGPLHCREELPDRTGFGPACCGKAAKFLVELNDGSNLCVCGKHARRYRRHHAVHPLPDQWVLPNARTTRTRCGTSPNTPRA